MPASAALARGSGRYGGAEPASTDVEAGGEKINGYTTVT
jgi:hypothetical protein